MRTSVIIPTLDAESRLAGLLDSLRSQAKTPDEILVVDSSSSDQTRSIARQGGCRVEVIPRADFGHGRTRNLAARAAQGDVLVFMTQDALPADERFLAALTGPIADGTVAAAYARQIPHPNAPAPERFVRRHNYPDQHRRKTAADIPAMGVRAFFFSNVAAAVRKDALLAVGGFPENVIVNEDMLLCASLLRAGHTVAYQPDAVVYHSHSYTLGQQFRRYFDIGVFFAQAARQLDATACTPGGVNLARKQIVHLVRSGAWNWVPRTVIECGLKYLGFGLGRYHRVLPNSLKAKCSRHAPFWQK